MEITLDLLLKGKATIIKDREFLPTKDYVEEFIKTMSKFTDKFIVNVTLPTQLTLTNKEEDVTFNKVWIQAIIPGVENLKEVINLIYVLDAKKPCYKVFRTYSEEGCHVAFREDWMFSGEIKEEPFKLPIKELMAIENNVPVTVAKMRKTFLDDKQKYDLLGKLVEKSMLFENDSISGKVKLSPTTVIKAHEMIYLDSTSKLYKKDQEATVCDLYTAFLTVIRDGYKKDPVNIFEKSILAAQILNII